jgi:hypothetical protein
MHHYGVHIERRLYSEQSPTGQRRHYAIDGCQADRFYPLTLAFISCIQGRVNDKQRPGFIEVAMQMPLACRIFLAAYTIYLRW